MEQETKEDRPSKVHLFLVVICANIPSLSMGNCIGWTSPVMPKLYYQYEDSPLDKKLTTSEASWIFSIFGIGALASALLAGHLSDQCGRKVTLMVGSAAFGLAFLSLLCVSQVAHIYAARIIQGIGTGFTMTTVPVYIGEVATKESRGSAGTFIMLFMTLGVLYVYCVGPYTEYWVMQVLCLAIPIISIGGFIYMPESPHYLVMNNRPDDAAEALTRIRGQTLEAVQVEISEIREMIEQAKKVASGQMADLFTNPGYRRALVIVVGLMFFQQCSGSAIYVINSKSIFMDADSKIGAALSAIIVGICQVLSSVTLQFFVDTYKRRTLLKVSALGMFAANVAIGTYFYIHDNRDSSRIRWIPIVAFIVFQLAYRVGLGPMPFAMLGELFPQKVKSLAAPLVTITCWGLGFVITFSYPRLNEYGTDYLFWGYSVFCFLAFIFTQFIVIETKDLSLIEIQENLQKIK